jgi:prepilin-type processing-associated H-X9-DG protein
MPSLSKARESAKRVFCLNNVKQLTMASLVYSEDNGGKIVPGYQKCISKTSGGRGSAGFQITWNDSAQPGLPKGGSWLGKPLGSFASEAEGWQIAIEYGLLFKYVKNRKSYLCPDEQLSKGKIWYSYAPSEGMNGWVMNNENDWMKPYCGTGFRKWVEAKNPSLLMVFADQGEFANEAGWGQYSALKPYRNQWLNPPMMRHTNGMTFSYADGHSELYKWKDRRTFTVYKKFMANPVDWNYSNGYSTDANPNPDLRYCQKAQWLD